MIIINTIKLKESEDKYSTDIFNPIIIAEDTNGKLNGYYLTKQTYVSRFLLIMF